jgi:hypothetical protein
MSRSGVTLLRYELRTGPISDADRVAEIAVRSKIHTTDSGFGIRRHKISRLLTNSTDAGAVGAVVGRTHRGPA